jgi:hypothetical protein
MTKAKRPRINTADRIYKLYSEKGVGAAIDYANKHNIPYEYCDACEADMPSKNHICLICGQATTNEPLPEKRRTNYNAGGFGQF